jgi:hypothetical protein
MSSYYPAVRSWVVCFPKNIAPVAVVEMTHVHVVVKAAVGIAAASIAPAGA